MHLRIGEAETRWIVSSYGETDPLSDKVKCIEVRSLLESDAAAWWQIRLESLESEPFAFGMAVEEHRLMAIESVAQRFREPPEGSFYLGAFEGDNLIGMANFIRETGS